MNMDHFIDTLLAAAAAAGIETAEVYYQTGASVSYTHLTLPTKA